MRIAHLWEDHGATAGWIAAVVLVALAFAGLSVAKARLEHSIETDPATGCLRNRPAPVAVLAQIDTTDKMVAADAVRFESFIDRQVSRLPAYSRLVIVPFGASMTSTRPIFNMCTPGTPSQASRWTAGRRLIAQKLGAFKGRLDAETARIGRMPDQKQSPIAEHVVRLSTDASLGWTGDRREYWLVSDGLEAVPGRSVYRTGRVELPPARPGLLAGARIIYFELVNARDRHLQTGEARETWKQWFTASGSGPVLIEASGHVEAPPAAAGARGDQAARHPGA